MQCVHIVLIFYLTLKFVAQLLRFNYSSVANSCNPINSFVNVYLYKKLMK